MLSMKDLMGDLAGVQRAVQDDPTKLNASCLGARTPLIVSCSARKCQPAIARWLISQGADLDVQDESGWTALMLACRYDQPDTAKALMKKGADLDLQNKNGWTALMLACRYGQPDTAKALIEKGASLDLQQNDGWTALMSACYSGQPDTAKALIEKGASLDLQTNAGWTALMVACQSPERPCDTVESLLLSVKLCYAGGADLSLKMKDGLDALATALQFEQAGQVAFLEFVTTSRVARILLDELRLPRSMVVTLYDKFLSKETTFSSTKIGDAGAQALAEAIANDKLLTRLDLSDGQIGDRGAEALASALGMNEALVKLDLRKNAISDKGASALANAMERSTSLQKIWLDSTKISHVITERIDRRGVKVAIDNIANREGSSPESEPEPEPTMATLVSLAAAAETARAANTRYHDFFDDALSETVSILACLDDPLAVLRPFEGRMQAIKQQIEAFEALQKAVVTDASLAASRDEKRSEILAGIRSILADGLEAKVATLATYESPEDIQSACERTWEALFSTPFELFGQCPTYEDVQAGGQVLADARKAWRSRHDFSRLQCKTVASIDALDARMQTLAQGSASCLPLREPAQVQRLSTEKQAVEQAFRAELDALSTDDGMADAPLDEIRTALTHLTAFYASTVSYEASRWREDVAFVSAQLADLSQGSTEPATAPLGQQLRDARRARRDLELIKARLDYARGEVDSGDPDAAGEVARLEAELAGTTSIFKLDREVRRARADVLRHAESHYPELLHDVEWCKRIGITDDALVGVGKLNLWLGNVSERDFEEVQELSSRPGKTTKRVRDPAGRELVLKQFHLGSGAFFSRFYRQVQALAEIDSAFVVRIEGLFTETSVLGCILMPYYPGGDLAAWIRDNPHASMETRKRIAVGILTGVHAVHQHDLVHCDIKPENIFLTEGLSPVLGDFDGVQRSEMTMTRPLQTTIKYNAPELRDGDAERVGPAVDMYSVGVVLNELFPEPTSSLTTLISSLCSDDPAQRPSALEALHHEAFHSEPVRVESCGICLEAHPAAEGVSCVEGHFTCKSCLSQSVQAASQPGAHVKVLRDGSMRCISPDCEHLVAGNALAAAVPEEDFGALLRIVREHFERDAALEQEREVRRRVDAALREHGLDPVTQNHLRAIQEEVLTMSCPRCFAAFADFGGCCALKCSTCPCYFCAWCLQDTGNDSQSCHRHVARCGAKPASERDPFYSDFDVVQRAWAGIRAQRLRAYFSDKISDAGVRAKVREKLMPLLTTDIVGEGFAF